MSEKISVTEKNKIKRIPKRGVYERAGLIQSLKSCASVILNRNLSTIIFHLSTIPKIISKNDSG